MSAFGKLLSMTVAAITLLVWTGVAVVSAQGPWVAPPDAKATKNTVKGVGSAKKAIDTNCVSCHGPMGKGDGPAAAALPPPKPANWTADAVQKQTDGELFWKISNGRGAMPPWKHLPDKERWDLVSYVRSLQGGPPAKAPAPAKK